ncbi:DUF3048 domain-containing protein [Mumia zhuanghuii]|uniref:DUF3048 domain-containing protein n=1 Tax=Mumia zhuanghuii TaxID=2585211 RepID=A0A5C4MG07_9ACTN|nr:DUF3048 domain-containing protein [Mumia zhuanghuii]TNC41780.1 DUF3048 domain-containing protein [Mumia zhuanghuii]
MPVSNPLRATVRATAALAALAVVAACSSTPDPKPEPSPASPDASRDASTLVRANPFTGAAAPKGLPDHPAFLVKIENTAAGAPQYGLSEADMVVEELVEGGLTRLAAFFYSQTPDKVGHVRSTRTTDIALVKPTRGHLIASGGAGVAIRKIKAAGVAFHSEDTKNVTLTRDPGKRAPYDRLLDLDAYAKQHTSAKAPIPAPYLPFGATPTTAKKKATSFDVRFSRGTATRWRYADGRYARVNGHAEKGKDFRPDTVLVLFTRQADAGYRDPAGNPVPETVFTGKGKAVVLQGGTMLDARWSKKNAGAPLRLAAGGKPVVLEPGKVFVELVPQGPGGISVRG